MPNAILITHIGKLVGIHDHDTVLRGKQLSQLPFVEDSFLLIEGDQIVSYGPMTSLEQLPILGAHLIDAKGGYVLPAWCDSHTHIVYAGNRVLEFVDRIIQG